MDEIRARIIAHSTVLQLQGDLPDFTGTDPGDKEIDCLPFDMQTVTCSPAAAPD